MMRTIFLVGCLALAAAGARAESAETTADIRCFAAGITVGAAAKDPTAAAAVKIAMIYYLGRLDGREPGLDLTKRLHEELVKMSPQDISAENQRCGKVLVDRGTAIIQMGQEMKKPKP